ncbi:tudor domain-containing protein 15 [Heptranchias perlo]|uniref:tudor domain-containing protein 15 n=1 Tax=Heptranchias perlo TaxID=212740 RepID=UPI00355ACB6D
MCSTFALPAYTLHLDLNITRVECHPEKTLVHFWGRYSNVCELDYHILHNEVQNAAKTRANIAIDEFCFAEDIYNGGWHRGRVIRKDEESYEVFLIDVGKLLTVDARHIAPAYENLFQLPPQVVCGIFANIVPVRGIWSPTAVKYFASLATSEIKGCVEDILMNQIVLVEVPSINQKLFELGLAKILDGNTFHFVLEMSEDLLGCPGYENTKLNFQRILDVLSPSLQTGAIETVKITCASGLHNFYCQLKRLASELEAMTRDMHCYYESEGKELSDEPIDNFGALCAAKGKDGRWYRGVVKQLLTSGRVEVWFMDYGNTEVVFLHHIKKLMPIFFMMPLLSFPCALTGLPNQTKQWISLQTDIFKKSLFEEALSICIDSYSCKEHLYYVTLYNHKNINIHQMSGMLSEGKLREVNPEIECGPKEEENKDINGQFGKLPETKMTATGKVTCKPIHHSLRSDEMKVNASYVGFVEYVINPSDFWIQTSEYNHEFECLMNSITDHYSKIGISEELIQKPAPGLFCCARYSKDLHYYRAVIIEVLDNQLRVFFVDFGNAEVVDFNAVKSLLPEYTKLPALAMNCSVAHVFPIGEVWTKEATNFFKKSVFNKQLFIEVVSKQGSRYIIDMQDTECMEPSSISALMLKAGYADFWNVQPDVTLPRQRCKLKFSGSRRTKSSTNEERICTDKNSKVKNSCGIPVSHIQVSTAFFPTVTMNSSFPCAHLTMSTWTKESTVASPYRQQVFKLGSVLDVRVSHVDSPAEFWCQLQSKSSQLQLLMRNVQHYYSTPRDTFQFEHIGCVAKYSKDGQWYRASVIQRNFPKEEVTVLFVDYGIQQKIAKKNLCAINPEFLQLEGQAFRCTLNSIIQSVNHDPNDWDQVSCNTFKQFIDNTLISGVDLKCTIFAMALMDGKGLCNVVDLHTPCINACQLLLDKGLVPHVESAHLFSPSIQLYTHYYSAHGMKIGSEEDVYVTHVSSLAKFYCQLEKNTVFVDKLMTEVNLISKQMQEQKLDLGKTIMCLAKYFEDGQWYRAIARSVQSPAHFKVFFIDYGNTEIVDKNDVVPIPKEAKELILIPMQAVKCCLSLHLQKLPEEVITLFKETVMGKPLKAFVVAKKSDGQLVLELYDGSVKISAQITEQHMPYCYGKEIRCLDETKWQSDKSLHPIKTVPSSEQLISKQPDYLVPLIKETNRLIRSFLRTDLYCVRHKNKEQDYSLKKGNTPCKAGKHCKDKNSKYCQNKIVPKFASHLAKLKKTYNKKNSSETVHAGKTTFHPGKTKMASRDAITFNETLTTTKFCHLVQNSAAAQNARDSFEMICRTRKHCQTKWLLQNLIDLPQPALTTGVKFEKYISHVNSSSDDFLQLEHNEHRTPDLAIPGARLKNLQNAQVRNVDDEFIENDAWYCAVVKEIKLNALHIKLIDLANAVDIDLTYSKSGLLEKKFLPKPRLQGTHFDGMWRSEAISLFTNVLTGKNIVCEFVRQSSHLRKVHLSHSTRSSAGKFLESELTTNMSSSQEALKLNRASEVEKYVSELGLSLQDIRNASEKIGFKDKKQNSTKVMSCEQQYKTNKELEFCIGKNLLMRPLCLRIIAWLIKAVNLVSVSNNGDFRIKLNVSPEELFPLTLAVDENVERGRVLPLNAIERRFLVKSKQCSEQEKSIIKLLYWEGKMVDYGSTETILLPRPKISNDNILNFIEQVIMCPWNTIEKVKQLLKEYLISPMILLIDQKFIKLLRKLDSGVWEVEVSQNPISFPEKHQAMVLENDIITASQDCLPDLDGWMNKMTFTEMEINIADKQCLESSETLLSVDNSMICLSLNSILCCPIQTRTEYTGFATSVIDPSEFCIQLEDSFETMETLSSLLAKLPENLHALSRDLLNPGVSCLIKCATDEQWSRVEIYVVSQQFVLVRAVDYGHYIFIPSSDLSRLRALPKELAEVPRLTNPCSLSGVVPSTGQNWTDEAIIFFQKSLNKQNLTVFFRQPIADLLWEVDLVISNKSVAEDLVSAGHAAFLKGIPNSSTEDSVFRSVEIFQELTALNLEGQFHKNSDELTVLPGEEPITQKF